MPDPVVSSASVMRLSRYHCLLGEILRSGDTRRITSGEIAEELGVSNETVRRDLSYVDVAGRPGAGYDPGTLYEALESFLGLSADYPFVAVGSRSMLESLEVIFPAAQFGMRPVAYFSDRPEDVGSTVHEIGRAHV